MRISEKINFDGTVDEAFWNQIPVLPLKMHWPNYAGELTEETEIRMYYDDEFIYVGAISYDSEPDLMQEVSFERDAISEQSEGITLTIDPYNDNENALVFFVTLTGSRADMTIKNDAQGAGNISLSWNSYWDAKVSRKENGWHTEIKIPFSSLRFQVEDDKVKMGIGVYRFIPRKREMQVYPDIPPDWGYWSFVKPSKLQLTEFEGIKNKRPWYITPYILGGVGYHNEYDDLNNPEKVNDNDLQIGLDVQHAFSDNLNADFTINTDFAQVEADDQAVNLSRFSLFFPEKRRFFLERSSTFDFISEGNNNLFYSRRIGIYDGQMVPMLGGARFVGRVNKWDYGVINLQSRKVDDISPENYGVFRLRRNVLNEQSYIGGMFTSRISADGHENYAFGMDGLINVFGEDYLKVNLAKSDDSDDLNSLNALEKSRIYIQWLNRKEKGFGYDFSYSNVGSDYNPGLGFERRFNFTQVSSTLGYNWFLNGNSTLRTIELTAGNETSFSNSTSELETLTFQSGVSLGWNRGSELELKMELLTDRVPDNFSLSDEIEIVAEEYKNVDVSLSYSTATGGLLRLKLSTNGGSFYGGDLYSASLTPSMIVSKYLQLSGFYQYTHIDFQDLNEEFNSHLARLKMTVSMNVKWTASTFAQVNSLNEISSVNFRLRYNPMDGNDFYLVYNEVINNNSEAVTPNLPVSETRAIMAKYVHTFKF